MTVLLYEPVIGLEVHAELNTRSKMFCACPVLDALDALPNTAVCPVCAGMPGVLPVINQQAVAYAIKVGLALHCRIHNESIFERKNYFYPDLPKGYQISQYHHPLAEQGFVRIITSQGEKVIRINRVHMEEDAGKLTHVNEADGKAYSLVDLNRAGLPLLEIVTEPDVRSLEEMRAYASELRAILRVLGVNSGDMEKGVIRFEANISLRPAGSQQLGKRVEIKNLNSFRGMERAVAYEIERQRAVLQGGGEVEQETRAFNEAEGQTYVMRGKEDAHDYRYFPEPDLPPLVVSDEWIDELRGSLPELPAARRLRLAQQYDLEAAQAARLVEDAQVASFFEAAAALSRMPAKQLISWLTGAYFAWMNEKGAPFTDGKITPERFAALMDLVQRGEVNRASGIQILREMLEGGATSDEIIAARNLGQVSDRQAIEEAVEAVMRSNLAEVSRYRAGKTELLHWFFGLVMKALGGKGNPEVVRVVLEEWLQRSAD